MKPTRITLLILALFVLTPLLLAQDLFVRKSVIPVPAIENGGFGNFVAGVDLDGDGKPEIYAVNNNWSDAGNELIPRIYKYEFDGTDWVEVWSATLDIPLQNTWPALAVGDLDNDGKGEIIWGPVNFTSAENPAPARVVVFEVAGDGSDVLGVPDGTGNYKPNAAWTIVEGDNQNMRPIKWEVLDIDGDGKSEIVFTERAVGGYGMHMGVISVDNIPDNGDGSETWTLEFGGKDPVPGVVRTAKIDVPPIEIGGFGEIIAGVDLDGDGLPEIYAVNDNWNDQPDELIPRIYKYEFTGTYWKMVWSAVLDIPKQNTWPALAVADLDKDGKKEIVWGPVNFTDATNTNPARVVVFEVAGDGSDVLGVPDGTGNYKPNAQWTIVAEENANERPFKWLIQDVDGDGNDEIVFGARAGTLRFGVISVDNIPDNGDGSETWTLKASGLDAGMTIDAGTIYDLAIIDPYIYLIHSNGNVTPIKYEGGAFVSKPVLTGKFPGGSWKTASVVDIDGDGTKEFVVGGWSGGTGNVYLAQPTGDDLTVTIIGSFAALGATYVNGGSAGDIDGDGKIDFIFGSRTGVSDPLGSIYRLKYLGGDITNPASYEASIIDQGILDAGGQYDIVRVADMDGDGKSEVFYSGIPRSSAPIPIGVLKYGDGVIGGGNKQDLAIVDNYVFLFDGAGNAYPIKYENQRWQVLPRLTGITPTGVWLGSTTTDIDGDGVDEIIVGEWSGTKVRVLQLVNGGLKPSVIADLASLGAARFNGAASGDIDGDGKADIILGSRDSNPPNSIYRIKYIGGDIHDPTSYTSEIIDQEILPAGTQLDAVKLANVDDDPDLEVLYSGIPRGGTVVPIVILDLQKVASTPIATVRLDADGDYIPDNIGQTFTVIGIVNSVNFTASANRFSYYIQDENAGINITKGNETGGGTVYAVGDRLMVTGVLGHFRGTPQLEIADLSTDVVLLDKGNAVNPIVLTIPQYLANPETYESRFIQINGVAKTATSPAWPAANADANMIIWDGYYELILRVDRDTDLDDNPEPTYPVNIKGVATQYTSAATVYDDGYQISPNYYADITQNVAANPSPFFFFTDATHALDGTEVTITDPATTHDFSWHAAIDLNNDPLIYQLVAIVGTTVKREQLSNNNGAATDATVTSTVLRNNIMGTASDTVTVKFTLRTKSVGTTEPIVPSVDTVSITYIWAVPSSVDDMLIPKEFFVDQNYPNPFNPTTTIRFGLPTEMSVDLRIFNVLGEQVAVLFNNELKSAGTYNVPFDASRLASGTYIYRLQAGENVVSKKMLLIK